MKNWLEMTAAELGRGIEDGSIDPVTLTETYLAAIQAHPLKDRIYARVTADRARAEAAAAAARARAGCRRDARAPSAFRLPVHGHRGTVISIFSILFSTSSAQRVSHISII